MILLQIRVSDSQAWDGTSLQIVGVFSSMDAIRQMLFGEHAGEIVDHVEEKQFNQGRFKVHYHNGHYMTYPMDKYEYDIVELDKPINS